MFSTGHNKPTAPFLRPLDLAVLHREAEAALQKQFRGDRDADSSRGDSASLSARGRPGPVLASSNYAAAGEENSTRRQQTVFGGGGAVAAAVGANPAVPGGTNAGEWF